MQCILRCLSTRARASIELTLTEEEVGLASNSFESKVASKVTELWLVPTSPPSPEAFSEVFFNSSLVRVDPVQSNMNMGRVREAQSSGRPPAGPLADEGALVLDLGVWREEGIGRPLGGVLVALPDVAWLPLTSEG